MSSMRFSKIFQESLVPLKCPNIAPYSQFMFLSFLGFLESVMSTVWSCLPIHQRNQGFWIEKGAECLNDGEMAYDNSSRLDPKRSHQWFMDGPEAELFPNKKQATGVPSSNHFSRLLNSNIPAWGHTSSFHSISGPFGERLFDSPATRAFNFDDPNVTSVTTEKFDPGRKVSDDLFGNDSSFDLSMSQSQEDHRAGLSYGIRKVKVSQVKDSENVMAVSMGLGYDTMDNNSISMAHAYSKSDDGSISMGLAYNKEDPNLMSIADTFVKENNIFISMAQPYNEGNDNISIGRTYKENNDGIQMAHTFSKVDNNIISMGHTYNKVDDNTISMGHIYNKGDDSTISLVPTYNKDDSSSLSIGQSYTKGESTIISFGGYDEDDANPSGTLLPTYGVMIGQSSVNTSEALNQKDSVKTNADTLISSQHVTVSGAENNSVKKEDLKVKTSKKAPSNNFPSNVRSLLSTGMLDGVPVKYVAWSREKELRGVIKGSGYQCSCQSCNYSKVINAFEFERHAGCKTKHPNNHIYFENGKTVYGIVQELRSTPQNMLFDVIQTITGSQINQKSFRLWKESFLAATRELQRIYGKEEGKQLS